jgi:tRNA G18 (ribose-2'-O)-methylase SpoU
VPAIRPAVRIADPDDPRLADYVGLTDPALRRRVEAEQGFFIAESPLVVRALVESRRALRSVLVTPAQHAVLAGVLEHVEAPVYIAEDAVLRQVVGFDLHRGAVASGERWALPPASSLLDGARRVAVVVDAESADPLYRRCVRVSIGHALTVPWTRLHSLDEVRDHGFALLALTPAPSAVPIDEISWPERHALLLGAEGPGLSQAWLDAADVRVRIPMDATVDSLNVATAAAIAFYAST